MSCFKATLFRIRPLLLAGSVGLATSCHPKHEVPAQDPPAPVRLTKEAAQQVKHPAVRAFLEKVSAGQADINAPLPGKYFQRNKVTALHIMAAEGDVDTVRALAKAGARLDAPDKNKNTPAHTAALYGQEATIEALHQLGADLNCQNQYGNTPLHKAAYAGNLAAVQALIKAQVDLNKQANLGYTALHKAILQKHGPVVEALVQAGADLQLRASFDFTPLHDAVFVRHVPSVKALLRGGADVTLRDVKGRTPLALARARSKKKDGPAADTSTTQAPAEPRRKRRPRLLRRTSSKPTAPQKQPAQQHAVWDLVFPQVAAQEAQEQQIIELLTNHKPL